MKLFPWVGALAVALAFGAGPAAAPISAQAQYERAPADKGPHQPHPEALAAIDRLKSPYCPGFMLEVCPSPNAAALRDSLDMLARQGMDADQLVAWMLANHGDTLSALPEKSGRSLVAWLVPPLVVILGIGTVVVVLRHLRRPHDGPAAGEVSEAEQTRLDDALRALEAEEETPF